MRAGLQDSARILAINIARISDTVLATPLLRALKAAVPFGELTCIAHPKRIEVLRGLSFIDRLLPMTKRSAAWRGWFGAKPYDLVVALGRDPVMLRYSQRVGRRVAAFRQADEHINDSLAFCVPSPTAVLHAVDERLLLAGALGIATPSRRLAYEVTAAEAAWADGWLREQGVTGPLVGIQASSFHTKPYRDWPVANFRDLSRRILDHYADATILLFGDAGDVTRALAIAGDAKRIRIAAGHMSLRQSAAVMQRLALYIGVDTGPTHIAGALGIPMIALYHCKHRGRDLAPLEHPAFLAIIEHPTDDRLCSETDGMAEIDVDTVWSQVRLGLA